MTAYIEGYLQKPKLRGRTVFFRIHQSGDFYSRAYLDKWIAIARHFTGRKIIFQAYTKSLDYFNGRDLSRLNIKVLYSVWHDTPPDQVTVAKRMGLALFVAATPIEVVGLENEGAVVCPWTCGTCQECYTGTAKLIAIPYH
jgi:hypothetical protein